MFLNQKVTQSERTDHNLTYLCFLPPVILGILSGLSTLISMDTGTAGGVGFLILIPLSLVALVSIPAGVILSFRFYKDYALLFLSFLTILFVLEIFIEAGSVKFYNTVPFIYAVAGISILASWFLFRRKRYYLAR